MTRLTRRNFLSASGAACSAALFSRAAFAQPREDDPLPLRFAVKYGMVKTEGSMLTRFQLLKKLGFDGVELDSPNAYAAGEAVAASRASGLPIHGVVDSIHWQERLSHPDEETRERGVAGLLGALRHAKEYGGSSVLLVPGRVNGLAESQQQVWDRSIAGIRRCLPTAAELGIHILIENVWNGFCYEHEGGDDQGAEQLRDYIDAFASPWVGSYFDIGNHRKYGRPERWIRTLGRRIVKLDVKDWSKDGGWAKIGAGDIDWPAVRAALADIRYTGWATAEVGGGERERLAEIKERMDRVLRDA